MSKNVRIRDEKKQDAKKNKEVSVCLLGIGPLNPFNIWLEKKSYTIESHKTMQVHFEMF